MAVPGNDLQAGNGKSVGEHHPGEGAVATGCPRCWDNGAARVTCTAAQGSGCLGCSIPQDCSWPLEVGEGSAPTGRAWDKKEQEAVPGPDAKPSAGKPHLASSLCPVPGPPAREGITQCLC